MRALLIACTVVVLPLFTSAATIAELQAQLTALMAQVAALQSQQVAPVAPSSGGQANVAAPTTSCLNISRNLSRGMKGSDVTQLQQFLISQNLLSADSATGFFGALTESAVQRFQCRHMSLCTGLPEVTGYGVVGPMTRATMLGMCTGATSVPLTTTLTPPTPQQIPTPSTPSLPSAVPGAEAVISPVVQNNNTFYVDNTCSQSGNGASQQCATTAGGMGAFNSLATMMAKAGGYAPGNQILLKRGQTYREILVMPSSGSSGNPIRIGTYGEGARPIILGSDTKTNWQSDGFAYVAPIEWEANLVLQGDVSLRKAASRAAMTAGSFFIDTGTQKIYVWPHNGAAPSQLEISRRPQKYYGLVMDGWTGNSWIEFDGLELKNANWMSYRVFGGKGITIKNSVISNGFYNAIIAMGTGQGASSDPDGLKVLDNTIKNHGYAREQGFDGAAGISVDGADGFTIERNTIQTNYGEGIETYNTANNGVIAYNTVRDQEMSGAIYVNASFGRPTSNISVHDNTISGGSDKAHTALTLAIEGTGAISNVTFANNTVSGYASGGGLVVGSGAGTISGSVFQNNTITNSLHGIEVIGGPGLTFTSNVFKMNTVNLSSNGSTLLVTEGGAAGNTFTHNSFKNIGSVQPIYWLGKYYSVPEWEALLSGTIQAPITPITPTTPATTTIAKPPSTSCVYGSNTGAARTLASSYSTKDACVSACIAVRNSDFGVSDSGVCSYTDSSQVTTQTTISPIACIYSSNTGSIQYTPVNSSTTKDSCKTACVSTRNQFYGSSDTGVCLYYGPLGTQEVMSI